MLADIGSIPRSPRAVAEAQARGARAQSRRKATDRDGAMQIRHSLHADARRHLEGRLFPRRRSARRPRRPRPPPAGGDGLARPAPDRRRRRRASADQQGRDRLALDASPAATSISCSARSAIDKPTVDTTPNCGNILAGVGPFAIERGLIAARRPRHARARAHAQHRHDRRTADRDAGRAACAMTARRASTACPAPPRRSPSTSSTRPARSAARCCRPAMPSTVSPASTCTLIDNGMPVIVLARRRCRPHRLRAARRARQGHGAESAARGDPPRRRTADESRRCQRQGRAEDRAGRGARRRRPYRDAQLHPA